MSCACRHVIWDWNGTLLDDVRLCVELFNDQLSRIGRPPVTVEEYRHAFTHPVVELYRNHGFAPDELEPTMLWWIGNYERRRVECLLHSGAEAALEGLGKRGIGQSILSAHQHEMVLSMLEHTGLRRHFHAVRGLGDHRAHSKVDNGRALLGELGLSAEEVFVIGDTTHDYEVASALGAPCVLVSHGFQSEARLRACGVPVTRNLAEAVSLVRG